MKDRTFVLQINVHCTGAERYVGLVVSDDCCRHRTVADVSGRRSTQLDEAVGQLVLLAGCELDRILALANLQRQGVLF